MKKYFLLSNRAGFSLVEMLMALLVASLLLAALAPVITKRFSENLNVSGSTGGGRAPAAMRCYTYSDTNPVVTLPLDDVWYANFIIVSAGGGGGGASKENEEEFYPYVAADGTASKNLTVPVEITSNMALDSLDVSLVGGGGGGGGAAAYGTVSNMAQNKTEGGTYTGPVNGVGCPAGSVWDNGEVNCVYAESANKISSSNMAGKCSSLTLGGVTAGQWRLPTRAEITNYWTTTQPGDLKVGYSNACYWTSEFDSSYSSTCRGNRWHAYMTGVNSWATNNWLNNCSNVPNCYYRCVLRGTTTITTDTTVNFTENTAAAALKSFSAPSGGSGAGFNSLKAVSSEAYSALVETIRNNPGGKIMITAGGGGDAGTSKTSKMAATGSTGATNGLNGSDSCLSITEADGSNVIYEVCAKGGLSGAGITSISNVSNVSISTPAAVSQVSSGCYYTYQGVTKSFNCEGGNQGAEGSSNYKTDAVITRDSLVYPAFSVTSVRTLGANGLNIPSLTLSGISVSAGADTYGAGGNGGGTQIAVNSDGLINYVYTGSSYAPTSGGGGFGRVVYKKKYDAAGGGGGGGGAVAHLTKLYVGKTSECTFTIGKGGSGGNAATTPGGDGSNGFDGGESSVSCSTLSATYTVPGGNGGLGGVSTTPAGGYSKGGGGGKGAVVQDSNIFKIGLDERIIKNGQNGENSLSKGNYFPGGTGGASGTGTFGGCGALFNSDDNRCVFNNTILPTAEMLIGQGFADYNEIIHPVEKNLTSIPVSYGTAGAGGGGGGWYKNIGTGKGGDGMGGYVCVYWQGAE